MSNRESADKSLRCANCGDGFIFSAGEQELFRLRGIQSWMPKLTMSTAKQ